MPEFFGFDDKELTVFPVWIQLEGLPLKLWSEKALGKICSEIGRPICTDKLTANVERVSFARVLVEVDIAKPPKNEVQVFLPNGESILQKILYERLPKFCSSCSKIGHVKEECRGDKQTTENIQKKRATPVGGRSFATAQQRSTKTIIQAISSAPLPGAIQQGGKKSLTKVEEKKQQTRKQNKFALLGELETIEEVLEPSSIDTKSQPTQVTCAATPPEQHPSSSSSTPKKQSGQLSVGTSSSSVTMHTTCPESNHVEDYTEVKNKRKGKEKAAQNMNGGTSTPTHNL